MVQRKKCIVANWKLNKTRVETKEFIENLRSHFTKEPMCDVLIAPSYTSIEQALRTSEDALLQIGAQNVSEMSDGAFTGEVSIGMLQELGVHFVIIGHSERRSVFGESDERIRGKMERVQEAGMPAILCVGESLEERDAGHTHDVIKEQVRTALQGFTRVELLRVAYEPVWAIGTGRTATPDQAQQAHKRIRILLAELFGDRANEVQILYGGSVRPENTYALLKEPDIDGCLVGGASLDSEQFYAIIVEAEKSSQ